jgi:hypothetical protein
MDQYTRLLVENILRQPLGFAWSVQGLGMMRMYLSDQVRLHIWDSSLKVPGVSAIHSHPWDLKSTVVAGRYKQHRFIGSYGSGIVQEFQCATIKCGDEACVTVDPVPVRLYEQNLEIYSAGQSYDQTKDEIHLSVPEDGTVTLVTRTFHADRDHAGVYWRGKGGWVDAKPRPATNEEVVAIATRSLEAWF